MILRLKGGLGNQLFQYAAMRALSLRLGLELKLDIDTGFANDPYHRSYRLGAFCLPVDVASPDEIERHRRASLLLWRLRRWVERKLIDGRGIYYCPWLITGMRWQSYVEGYWQSDRYFAPAADTLRKEIRPRPELRRACSFASGVGSHRPVVVVHARRLDHHPSVCPTEYYRRAYEHIVCRHPDARCRAS